MSKKQNDSELLAKQSVLKSIKVAICGNLPTAHDYLLRHGVVHIDNYMDATELVDETDYHLILIYAPCAEGLLNTQYSTGAAYGDEESSIPIRLLNEPCCHSALLELKSMIRRIANSMTHDLVANA